MKACGDRAILRFWKSRKTFVRRASATVFMKSFSVRSQSGCVINVLRTAPVVVRPLARRRAHRKRELPAGCRFLRKPYCPETAVKHAHEMTA